MDDLKKLNENDFLKRLVEKESGETEYSPMDPPDAFSPPVKDVVAYEDYHELIRKFIDEHKVSLAELNDFEKVLSEFQSNGFSATKESSEGLKKFFEFLDNKIAIHNLKEEKVLFPLLQKRLIEHGDHSTGLFPRTAIDMLENDHVKLMQTASVVFNFFALASRLPEPKSRAITLDAAVEQGKALIELLRLHIFREENVVFPMAHKYLTKVELDALDPQFSLYAHY